MLVLEVPQDALECGLLLQPRPRADSRRHDLVVQGRHDDLDPVVVDDPQAVEQVLLRGTTLAEMAGRRCGQLIDELVDPDSSERCRRCAPEQQLAPRQAHGQAVGPTRTRPRIMRSRLATTWRYGVGFATCWLTV